MKSTIFRMACQYGVCQKPMGSGGCALVADVHWLH